VTEDVGSAEGRVDSGASKSTGHNLRDGVAREGPTPTGPEVLYEYLALVGRRTVTAQVTDDGTTGLSRKRQDGASARLPDTHLDGAGSPVNVLKTQAGNLTGPEPQGGETPHDGLISVPTRPGKVDRREYPLKLFVPQVSRKGGESPMSDSRDRCLDPFVAESLGPKEAEEGPQRRTDRLHRVRRVSVPQQGDDLDNVGGTEPHGIDRVVTESRTDKQTHLAFVAPQSLLAQAACAPLVVFERPDQGVEGP
jgi:hypothetical protein